MVLCGRVCVCVCVCRGVSLRRDGRMAMYEIRSIHLHVSFAYISLSDLLPVPFYRINYSSISSWNFLLLLGHSPG